VKLDGGKIAIEAWLTATPPERHHLLYEALFAIVEGSWATKYQHWDDVVRRGIVLLISDDEVLVWRQYVEYPDTFRVLYVGKIDY
jgi:hypothetical protein